MLINLLITILTVYLAYRYRESLPVWGLALILLVLILLGGWGYIGAAIAIIIYLIGRRV